MATAKRAAAAAAPDATELLMTDHKKVKALFKQYRKLADAGAPAAQKRQLALQICQELTVHTQIEEEIFYPAARRFLDEKDLLDEASVEHASAKDLIAQIESMQPREKLYDAKVIVLGEYVDHHVKEEEKEMFPKLKESGMDLQKLGNRLRQRKAALMAALGHGEEVEA
ncbi:hemerythrin domain-containing protein [Aquabacterium sp. A7-Y]|uniref:hemerythrin domain-containing protein n=1 Tax=Aquabacterium sp. A7-Y TaxID=1349605 RepID=UPI00223D1786|nr:hemerythrin domain-containing protein [Aquabacterium sp. A7-Y]MCW7536557.1 hemerythrin domain-containing protein [Aquabacterium sp. A7-Y]